MKNIRKKYYDQGGYFSNKNPPKPPKNPVRPPPNQEPQIYINPNNPNDYIYVDDNQQFIDPQYYEPNQHMEYYNVPPDQCMHPDCVNQRMHPECTRTQEQPLAQGEEDYEIKRLQRIVKNDKVLAEKRSAVLWDKKIENISDLLDIAFGVEKYNYKNLSLNQGHLLNLQTPLQKLKDLIGMGSIKSNIFNQLVFFLQNIEPKFPHMLHTCIEGPPGCGKTELANILADIYANLGIISEAKVIVARRSDLVAGFLGQTAQKTQEVIDSAKGGVLLIDEAYSLGNDEKKDSFAKECIDTINQNLTEGKGDFICIIAGYKEDLEKSFFGFNSGLERRFPYRFSIEEYDAEQLCKIYQSILGKNEWTISLEDEKKMVEFFKKEREHFKFNGGDLENFVHFSKLAYAKNRIFRSGENTRKISMDDINTAFPLYLSNKKKSPNTKDKEPPHSMYN